jgi:AcrR family transcriptional regulator
MGRWPLDARERLEQAALDLFAENGYSETTVAQIAERAGLNRATFFRHFTDKQEVLFGGEQVLSELFETAIRTAPDGLSPVDCIARAFGATDDVLTDEQFPKAVQRAAIAGTTAEVRERALLKNARIVQAIAGALVDRGTDPLSARLTAEVAMVAFTTALSRWLERKRFSSFAAHATAAWADVQDRLARQAGDYGRESSERAVSSRPTAASI